MYAFAKDAVDTLEKIAGMSELAVKVASTKASVEAQLAGVKASHLFYDVMLEKAAQMPGSTPVEKFCALVDKIADYSRRPRMNEDARMKISAALMLDGLYTDQLNEGIKTGSLDEKNHTKIASLRSYGREFIAAMLNEVFSA